MEFFVGGVKMEMKSALLLGVVVILFVVSIVQTMQLMELKDKVNSGVALSQQSPSVPQNTGNPGTLSQNINNLPTMVGGC